MRVCEERCHSRSVSSKESEIDSASNGEETDDMPALTDSDMSDIGEPEKERAVPPLTEGESSESERGAEGGGNQNCEPLGVLNKNKKVFKKKRPKNAPEPMSERSDNYYGTEIEKTTEDDYSDEDHVYLISSVANLRRREIMNLKPLRTQSKKTPRVRGRPPNVREGCPTISLEDTKRIIGDNLLRDERKIKYRNPKRHIISEEKWGEGTTWNDILQEG